MILIYKPQGFTPLEVINYLQNIEKTSSKLAYAGRLDPMAEGLLLILENDECKDRKSFENLDKTYEFEAFFGLSTDSYDTLGIITKENIIRDYPESKNLEKYILNHSHIFNQPYPPYSSARVCGKPLFYWARNGVISNIEIPSKKVTIKDIKLTSYAKWPFELLYEKITKNINSVNGDFRQDIILNNWKTIRVKLKNAELVVAKFLIQCSTGFYVRAYVNKMGEDLKIPATTLSIKRISIGNFKITDQSVIQLPDLLRERG